MSAPNGGKKLSDIAALVGCSVATVSNAINGTGRMSGAMREGILAKCAELNFVPNSAGRSLRLQRTDAVGVIYAPSFAELFGNVFYARIMEGLAETFGEAGMDIILGNRLDADGLPTFVRQGKVDALVVLAGVFDAKSYEGFRNCPVPLCIVDGHSDSLKADSLTSDGFGGARLAAEHLYAQGHRRILMTGYRDQLYNIEQRISGFFSGLRACGMEIDETDALIQVDTDAEAAEEIIALLGTSHPPTAVFAVNDTMAIHLIEALAETGKKVPEDISIIGFDDDPVAADCQPPLTTVRLGKKDFGAISARLVLDRLAEPDKPITHQILPTELVTRESVARV
jgi:LacI family transcriptional regulator